MKIVCDRGELLDVLLGVSKAVSSKSSIPALEGILFKCTDYNIILTAYDLEIGITASVSAEVDNPGEIVINAKLFIEMIRKIESEKVKIETDEDMKVTVSGGQAKFNIIGISSAEFPEMPIPEADDVIKIEGNTLKEMIGKTIYAVSASDQKPVHTGTKFIMGDNTLTLVSVDGYRLAVCKKTGINFSFDSSFVIPAKTLSEVSKLIGDSDEEISLGTARRYAVFRLAGYTVVSRLLEGDFLDYTKSIPDGYKTRVKIFVGSFFDSVERASLLINDRFKSPIKMVFEDNAVNITCTTALGTAHDELGCEIEGEAVEIGFNNRYILDALRYSGHEEVFLEISGSLSPMKIVPVEGNDFLFMVLPVRIKTNE